MRSRYWIALIFVFILGLSPLVAAVNRLDSLADFSPSRLVFDFTGLSEGTASGDIFRAWGVSFESADGDPTPLVFDLVAGQPLSALSNSNDGSSEGQPLVINLSRAVRQIGFTLRNGGGGTSADVRAYDNQGNLLGSVHLDNVNATFGPFLGLETSNADELISKVVIDYGDSPRAEQIIDLALTFSEPPFFTTYLAHIGDGAFSGNFFQTSIIVTNLSNTTAQGEVRLMGDDGSPLDLALIDEDSGEMISPQGEGFVPVFPVPGFSSKVFTTAGDDVSPPVAGYAEIRSSRPIAATAVFRAVVSGEAFEAGVAGGPPAHRILAAVTRMQGFDSGIAVANPNGEAVSATIRLLNAGGSTLSENSDFLDLAAGEHKAAFLPDIFPDLDFDQLPELQGSILINSELPLIVTVLRTTQGGLVSSSLPVGTPEVPQ